MTTYETVLKGCTPEPLMNYLKGDKAKAIIQSFGYDLP